MDIFAEEAGDLTFGMAAPLQLAKRYGASVYATARRYVMASDRVCAVLIFNPPIEEAFGQSVSSLRRVVASPSFEARFPAMAWPREIRSREPFARLIPDRRTRSEAHKSDLQSLMRISYAGFYLTQT